MWEVYRSRRRRDHLEFLRKIDQKSSNIIKTEDIFSVLKVAVRSSYSSGEKVPVKVPES